MDTTTVNKVLASPNTMLWQFYASLNRQVRLTMEAADVEERRQIVAVCIVLSITLVEAFFNIFFRVVVGEAEYSRFARQILQELDSKTLHHKVTEWPKLVFGRSIDFGKGVGQDFMALKNTRNWLMHFTNTYESFCFENNTIHGLADISKYEAFDVHDATNALATAEGIIAEVLKLRGAQPEQIPFLLQFWLGRIPHLLQSSR